MTDLLPDNILEAIEAQSRRLNHYYLGAEHLFLALLNLENSLLFAALEYLGFSPQYIAYRVEQALGQSPDRRFWEGFRSTPRYEKILELALRFDQYHLIMALLRENDNLPLRVMKNLGVDLAGLQALLENGFSRQKTVQPSWEFPFPLPQAAQELLNKLVSSEPTQAQEIIPQHLYVLPQANGYQVVLFDTPTALMPATERAEHLLPPKHSQLVLPQKLIVHAKTNLATLLSQPIPAQSRPLDFVNYIQNNGFHLLPSLLKDDIFSPLQDVFWKNTQRYQLQMWREYEFILPPALVIQSQRLIPEEVLHPLEDWSHSDEIRVGASVELQNFTVQALHPIHKRLILQAGYGGEAVYRASAVEVQGIENVATLNLGRSLPSLTGLVTQTRSTILVTLTADLQPTFDPQNLEVETLLGKLTNPIRAIHHLLHYDTPATVSLIHGDLRLDSILVDDHARLLHFQHLRRGHVLFDWATLESSLITDLMAPLLPNESWEKVWEVLQIFQPLNQGERLDKNSHPLAEGLNTLRDIVGGLLDHPQDWREYFAPLALLHLRYLQNSTAPLGARRLAWASAALTAEAFRQTNLMLEERL